MSKESKKFLGYILAMGIGTFLLSTGIALTWRSHYFLILAAAGLVLIFASYKIEFGTWQIWKLLGKKAEPALIGPKTIIITTSFPDTRNMPMSTRYTDQELLDSAFASWIKQAMIDKKISRLEVAIGEITYTFERKP